MLGKKDMLQFANLVDTMKAVLVAWQARRDLAQSKSDELRRSFLSEMGAFRAKMLSRTAAESLVHFDRSLAILSFRVDAMIR